MSKSQRRVVTSASPRKHNHLPVLVLSPSVRNIYPGHLRSQRAPQPAAKARKLSVLPIRTASKSDDKHISRRESRQRANRANDSQLQIACTTRHCDAAHAATTKSQLLRRKSHQQSTNAPHPSPIVHNRSLLILQPFMTVSRSSTHSSPANRRASHRRDAFEGYEDDMSVQRTT